MGLCIGRGGCVIKEMQQKTGTRIQIPSMPTPGQPHRIATVSGNNEGCAKVQEMIEAIITQQSSNFIMSGTPFNKNYLGQQYYGGGEQNGEHSAEWQAFYAAQAVAQQQQPHQQAATPAPAPAAQQQQADAYYEQFFRYAYYYGEDAARQYYKAWSPPVGTPNPYGINPNGITAAPAASAPAPSPAPAPAPATQAPAAASHRGVRETSVRKVSNLPAWMTKGN